MQSSILNQIICEDFDLYGRGWPTELKSYRGPIARKSDVLKQYKFSICYENIKNIPGYITEKMFDCFRAGCVPVYWGASNVNDYIPKNCFIDRTQFASNEELYQYLKNMNAQEYEEYICAIKSFLQSPQAQRFSIDNFIFTVVEAITSMPTSHR